LFLKITQHWCKLQTNVVPIYRVQLEYEVLIWIFILKTYQLGMTWGNTNFIPWGGLCICYSQCVSIKFPKGFPKMFPITPQIYPILFDHNSTSMYIKHFERKSYLYFCLRGGRGRVPNVPKKLVMGQSMWHRLLKIKIWVHKPN
jgi:hypothetical protein